MHPPLKLMLSAALLATSLAAPAQLKETARQPSAAASQPGGLRSPAVRAAENAKAPGEVRPEKAAVPQIAVPLKRRNAGPDASASAPAKTDADGVNDDVARCLARKTARERAECKPAAAPQAESRNPAARK